MFDVTFTADMTIRLMMSVILGALVGLERQMMHKPAGLRTHMLVCLGACLFTIVATYSYPSNPAPILAGILTGIGFIGAGTIMASHGQVQGVTTAATLWVVGSIGFITGAGNYTLAIIAAVIVFIILKLGKIEKKVKVK
jgi:putative Mg2+ transporter-C (MgtC) family protein